MGAKKSRLTNNISEMTYELRDADNGSNVGIYYINLDERPKRNEEMKLELAKMQLKGNRIEAIREYPGQVGCAKSHIKALQKGLSDGVDHILIFEDDFYFTVEPHILHQVLDQLTKKKYDVFMLGYCIFSTAKTSLFPTNHSSFKRIKQAQCSHGYMVNKKYAPKLIQNIKESIFLRMKTNNNTYNIDSHWMSLQTDDMWLCYSAGPIGMQRLGYSDIDNNLKWDNQEFINKSLGL